MKFLKGLGILLGLMFGAGIFALPFAISRAGIFWGIVHFCAAVFLMAFISLLYAKITYRFEGRHRFLGYVNLILGRRFKRLVLAPTLVIYYSILLAYGILGGIFLSVFFDGSFSFGLSLGFFAAGALLIFLKLGKLAMVNFYLTLPLLGFVVYLLVISFPFINFGNFSWGLGNFSFSDVAWFLPYGVWIFAFTAFAAIPEARDIFYPSTISIFKKAILTTLFVCSIFYCLFIFNVIGVSGGETSEDALSGLIPFLGSRALFAGSLLGFLAVFTSFLVIAIDMRDLFRYDFGLSKITAGLLVAFPPVVFFSLGLRDFITIISLVGSFGLVLMGSMIILMEWKMEKKRNRFLGIAVIAAILTAFLYEAWNIFF